MSKIQASGQSSGLLQRTASSPDRLQQTDRAQCVSYPCTCRAVRKFWGTKSVTKLRHSPYSPDLATCLAIPKPDDRSAGFMTLLPLRGQQELSITFGTVETPSDAQRA